MKTVVLLSKVQQRAAFDCGDAALNHYLQTTARQHQDKGIARTYVLAACRTPRFPNKVYNQRTQRTTG